LCALLLDFKLFLCRLLIILRNKPALPILPLLRSKLVSRRLKRATRELHLFLILGHINSSLQLPLALLVKSSSKFVDPLSSDGVFEVAGNITIFGLFIIFIDSGAVSFQIDANLLQTLLLLFQDVAAIALLRSRAISSTPSGRAHPLLKVLPELVVRGVL